MMFKTMILAAVALAWAHPAFADMTAHYVIDGDQSIMTMEIAANGDVRARFGSDASYFLTRAGHVAPARRFRDELEDHMSEDYADETLRTVTHWGRYAEVFAYDEDADRFSLDDAV